MMSFERLVLSHLRAITDPLLDPLQFTYKANRSVDNAINMALHYTLSHLTTSTGSTQGCVHSCTSSHQSVKLLKFADDTTLIGLFDDALLHCHH